MDPSSLPFLFSPPEVYPEYGFIAEPAHKYSREIVGKGIRYAAWPYCFEEYIGDIEPDLAISATGGLARNRKVIWKRIARKDVPAGWSVDTDRPWRVDGLFELTDDTYQTRWRRNAKRTIEVWNKHKSAFTIEPISFEEFCTCYEQSMTFQKAGPYFLDILKRKWSILPEHLPLLWGIRNIETNEIIAGTAVHFFEAENSSVLECPFFGTSASAVHASTGLMDFWFGQSLERGIKTLLTIYMWQPGDPPDWKKLTQFKSSFGFTPYAYPPLLYRYVLGKLF